jgi:hypothetical protein
MSDRAAVTHFTAPDGRELEITTEMIEVTSISEPDPSWTHVDGQGHRHYAATARDNEVVIYPTLVTIMRHGCIDEAPARDLCDVDGDQELCYPVMGCPQCGEEITPGTRSGRTRFLEGMTSYTIDGRHVSPDEAREFVGRWQRETDQRINDDARRAQAEGYL